MRASVPLLQLFALMAACLISGDGGPAAGRRCGSAVARRRRTYQAGGPHAGRSAACIDGFLAGALAADAK